MTIDFRIRPPLKGFLNLGFYRPEKIAEYSDKLRLNPSPAAIQRSMDLLLAEMDECDMAVGVVPGRKVPPPVGSVSNEDVAAIVEEYPGRFVGFAGINLSNINQAIQDLDCSIKILGLKGAALDPAWSQPAMQADDSRIYPIYQRCMELGVPVIVTSSVLEGPDVSFSHPAALDRVARDFPSLPIVVAQGGFPWVHEILGVAYRRKNLYLSPGIWMLGVPGTEDYFKAAHLYLEDRLIFSSGFPSISIKEGLKRFCGLDWNPEVLEKVLHENARRLLYATS